MSILSWLEAILQILSICILNSIYHHLWRVVRGKCPKRCGNCIFTKFQVIKWNISILRSISEVPNKCPSLLLTLATPGPYYEHSTVYQSWKSRFLFPAHLQKFLKIKFKHKNAFFLSNVFSLFPQLVSFKWRKTCLTTKLHCGCNKLVFWPLIWNNYKRNHSTVILKFFLYLR